MKKLIVASIAAAVAMFFLAGLYTGVLVKDFITANVNSALLRSPPNLILIFAGYLLLASLMAWFYPRLVPVRKSPLLNGACFGAITAVCWLMPYSLVLFGAYQFPYAALPIDFAWALVEQGVGGAVIGIIYGKQE